ncbi:PKD domain-containing protein [Shewanella psychromarinicola]|uniref:PKD domain-containing protein n=1 Tax=Shewanella psychromarinicola TaxID=2487742 RepID=UPI003F4BA339
MLTSVFFISACGGGSDADVDTAPAPIPAPATAPTPAANIAPTADAGADQSVNTQTAVILSGIGTDIDGTVTSYAWSQIAGASITLATADSATTSFDAPSSTTELILTFQLVVSDDDGAITSDTTVITVNPIANKVPTANAGADQ